MRGALRWTTQDGKVAQRSALTAGQKTILTDRPEAAEPPGFYDFTVATD